jgi:hypothetical protein
MYNKKILIDALKKLGSAKAPAQKKDIVVGSNNPTEMFAMQKGFSPYDKKLNVKKSNIHGKGLFTEQPLKKGELIGLAHVNNQPTPIVGNFHNHSENNATALSIRRGNQRYLVAAKDLEPGTEITTNYRLQPELGQPEDFLHSINETPTARRGGSAPKLPNKKNSRAYSRSLDATNRLFAEHPWFKKSKSRKNKIYDPNAKYYQDGGEQGCPEGYTYNPETKRCTRKNTNCPEGYFFDAQEGRCKSKAYREKFELYNKGTKITPTEEEESYSYWPDDLTLKYLDKDIMNNPEGSEVNRPFLINPIKTIGIYNPEREYEEDIDDRYLADTYVNVYPDLNYQVVVDPSKPKGYNADKSIYYVPDENNFEFEKFKQYKKLKEIEKENLSNLAKYPNLITKEWQEDYKYRPQDDPKLFLDAEYYGQGLPGYYTNLTNMPFDKYKNSIKREFNTGCKDCKYHYGISHEYNDDYNINLINLGHVKKGLKSNDPSYDIRNIKEYDYVDLPDESIIPRFDLESADTEPPIYREGDPSMLVPHMRLEPGKKKSKKHRGRLMYGKGQKYKWTTYRQTKDLEFGTHKTNRPIPALVQKFTGYDPKYYQGYDKEVGDETEFVPGEIERAEQEGRKVNFKGAATLRDLKKQKEYERQWLEYQKQKDEVRQRNEDYLKQYNITPEEYEQYYGPFRRGGQLPKAQYGIPQEFYQNWYQNRVMPTPEGQKLLDKIRPEALERSRQMIPYIYSDKLKLDDAGYYDTKTQEIILNKFLPEAQIEATKQHEFGHHIQAGNKFYNVLDKPHQFLVEQNIVEPEKISTGNSEWDEKLKENYDYVTQPDEMHARVMTLRRLAGFQPNQVITEKDLKDYFNRVKEAGEALDPDIEDLRGVTKGNQSIVNLLNDMVSVPSNREDLQVAKYGVELDLTEDEIKKYVDRGYVVEDISIPSLTKMKKGGLPCPPFCSPLIELSKGLSSIAQNIPKTNFLGRGIANTATILDEGLGQAFLAKSNADAISAGNKWLHNWIQHPTTQMKIQADMLDVINNKNLNPYRIKYETPRYGDIVLNPEEQYTEALKIAQNYMPDAKPYSFENFFSNLKEDKLNPMFDVMGITYKHQSDPIMRSLYSHAFFKPNSTQIDTDYKPFKHYGTFIRRSPSFSPYQKELVTIHEGTHEWITDKLLKETGQKDLILSSIDPEIKKLFDKWSVDRETKDLTEDEKKLAYLSNPTEVHARIMELRRHNNLTPSDYVDENMAKKFLEQIKNKEISGGKEFATVLKNDPKTLSKLMNDLYNISIPLGVGIGGASLLKNPYKEESPIGGYKMGGEFELGDEVDEVTMKELKKLGFTFEKI